MHGGCVTVDDPGTIQFGQQTENAAGTMHILDVVLFGHWCHFAQAGHMARDTIDVLHREIDTGFLGGSQNMQHRIG